MNTDPRAAVKASYPAPMVTEAPAGILRSGAVTNRVTIVTPTLTSLPPGAKIEIAFVLGTYLSAPVAYKAGMSFAFPARELGPYLGTHVLVGYDLTIDGVTTPSDRMDLHLMAFDDDGPVLPVPAIDKVINNILDLATFTEDPNVTCAPWSNIAVGQRVWLEVHGTLANGSANTIVLYTASAVVSSELTKGLNKAIPRARLEAQKDGSMITVKLWVTFDQSDDRNRATQFPGRIYALLTQPSDDFVFDPTPHTMSFAHPYTRTASGGKTPYTYVSSNTAVATVNAATGLVTAIKEGVVTITASDSASPKHSGSYALSVAAPVTLSGPDDVLVKKTFQFSASGGTPPYTFSSSDPTIARISEVFGGGVGEKVGICFITATDREGWASGRRFRVYAPSDPLTVPPIERGTAL